MVFRQCLSRRVTKIRNPLSVEDAYRDRIQNLYDIVRHEKENTKKLKHQVRLYAFWIGELERELPAGSVAHHEASKMAARERRKAEAQRAAREAGHRPGRKYSNRVSVKRAGASQVGVSDRA